MKFLHSGFFNDKLMKIRLFCFLMFLFSITAVTAQNNHVALIPEKIFLHTDRDIYIAGDNMFYTAYLQSNPGQTSKYLYLVLRDFNSVHAAELRLEIINGRAFGNLSLSDTLKTGIYQIICYTNCMRNNPVETYFSKEILIANRFDETMEHVSESEGAAISDSAKVDDTENILIILDKKEYKPDEKITFAINGTGLSENSEAYLSVAVSELIPGISPGRDISEYFGDKEYATDQSSKTGASCKYFSEIHGTAFQGRIVFSSEFNVLSDSAALRQLSDFNKYTILVSTPDSIVNMQFTKTDSSGSFRLLLNRFYDGRELIIRTKENVDATIITDNKFMIESNFIPSKSFSISGIKEALFRSSKIAQVRKVYNVREVIKTERVFSPSTSVPQLYYNSKPIYPADYVPLSDFSEISKEIIPALRIRKTRDRYVAEYPGLQYLSPEGSEPAIFLDGVPIDDINQIITMGSDQISRIESLPAIRYFGDVTFSGILSVFSRDNRISKIKFNNNVLRMNALSSQPYTRPHAFDRGMTNIHYPDLRQLLLWEPEIILKKNEEKQMELYASDIEGLFRIDIQGITTEGKPVHGSAVITVKSKPE